MLGLLVVGAIAASAAPVGAQVLSPTVGVDVVSTYVFRGFDVTRGPAVQPWGSVTLGASGLSFTAWSSFAVSDRNESIGHFLTRGGTDEVDLTVAYGRAVGPLSVGLGYIAYIYPAGQQDYTSQEVYGAVALAGLPVVPTVSLYYDFDGGDDADDPDAIEGLYLSVGATRSLRIGLPVEAGASLGLSNQESLRGSDDLTVHDFNLSAGVPIPLGPLVVTPAVRYTRRFEGADETLNPGDDILHASLSGRFTLGR